MSRLTRILVCQFPLWLISCGEAPTTLPGYVEGEYVHVAAPVGGRLIELSVQEGDTLAPGQPLFRLDSQPEQAAVQAAAARLQQSHANLADLEKGKRPEELAVIEGQIRAAEASTALARSDLHRQTPLVSSGAISPATLDSYQARVRQEESNLASQQASLRSARLRARDDQLQAAIQAVQAAEAELASQRWALDQKQQQSPVSAHVEEILYRVGEWVPAGSPVVNLLPPAAVKARFYLPQARRPELRTGSRVSLHCDGCPAPIPARVSYIANQVEFTPPVIYSEENRARQVFLVEAKPESGATTPLYPGQPLEVTWETPR